MENVSWYDAARSCNALSRRGRLRPYCNEDTWECDFAADGYRLPTEAEWEYAWRAGTTSEPYWDGADGNLFCWHLGNSNRQTHDVGTRVPNSWGLHDMSGNVWEWCNDWYRADSYAHSATRDPVGPPTGVGRVIRGGVWGSTFAQCRSANRSWSLPGRTYSTGVPARSKGRTTLDVAGQPRLLADVAETQLRSPLHRFLQHIGRKPRADEVQGRLGVAGYLCVGHGVPWGQA